MKKRKLIILITFIIFFFILVNWPKITTFATASDNGKSTYSVTNSKKSINIGNYTTHTTDKAITTKDGNSYSQQVNAFIQKQTKNSKVVTWAVGNGNQFTRMPISGIASNYEVTHPGWKVIGGINADQYYQKSGDKGAAVDGSDYFYPQPYYPMICDNEAWFSITTTPYGAQNIAGFLQDGQNDPIISGSANWNNGDVVLDGLYLSIIDNDGNRISKYHVKGINETPREDETTIWCPYIQYIEDEYVCPAINVTGNLFIVKGVKAYLSNSIDYTYKDSKNNQNAFFGKGSIFYSANSYKVEKGFFAIDTKDDNLSKALTNGTNVIVQYEYQGVFRNVESAIGYHTIQRMDNVDIPSNAGYNTAQYPRSMFGRNASGDIVLITVDGKMPNQGLCGTSHDETNAVLKYYGCVEAYQMDGGGSVTAIVRNSKGTFDIVNTPPDGSVRSVLSALLVVEKKEEVTSLQIIQKNFKVCAIIKND